MSNNFDLYKQSLDRWQEYSVKHLGHVEPTWTELDIPWEQTFCIEEIPENDNWGTVSSNFHMWLEAQFIEWGNIKDATEHYMSFNPELKFDLMPVLKQIKCTQFLYNFIKIPPGRMIPWHCDTYAYFVKRFNVQPDQLDRLKRAVVCMSDWDFGHALQIGNSVLGNWTAGDIYSWDHESWHGAANFGKTPLIFMQITYND